MTTILTTPIEKPYMADSAFTLPATLAIIRLYSDLAISGKLQASANMKFPQRAG